jgi:hypothetical protein
MGRYPLCKPDVASVMQASAHRVCFCVDFEYVGSVPNESLKDLKKLEEIRGMGRRGLGGKNVYEKGYVVDTVLMCLPCIDS